MLIPLKKVLKYDSAQKARDLPAGRQVQGAKFSRNKAYLAYVAMTGKLKQRRRLGFFSGIIMLILMPPYINYDIVRPYYPRSALAPASAAGRQGRLPQDFSCR